MHDIVSNICNPQHPVTSSYITVDAFETHNLILSVIRSLMIPGVNRAFIFTERINWHILMIYIDWLIRECLNTWVCFFHSIVEPEVPVTRSTGRVSQRFASQAGALIKVTQVGRLQRAQARANRHSLGRNCVQRQNHVRQRLPQHSSRIRRVILHQPGHRSLKH